MLLVADNHLYLRCDQRGHPLAIPERRRGRGAEVRLKGEATMSLIALTYIAS
jgi:hypothetical protein